MDLFRRSHSAEQLEASCYYYYFNLDLFSLSQHINIRYLNLSFYYSRKLSRYGIILLLVIGRYYVYRMK